MIPIAEDRSDRKVHTTCLLLLTIIAVGAALYFLRAVLVPFILALFLVYSLSPGISWLQRRLGFSRSGAIGTTVLITVILLALLGVLLYEIVTSLGRELNTFQGRIAQLLRWASDLHGGEGLSPSEEESSSGLPDAFRRRLTSTVATGVVDLISGTGIVVVFMFFIWFGGKSIPGEHQSRFPEIEGKVRRYILELVFFSALTGFLVGLTLYLLGVPFALIFGFLAFLLNFIPTLGSIVATLLPIPLVFLNPDFTPWQQVLAIGVPALLQFTIGNVIMPRVQSGTQNLHPAVTLMALIFFGSIWGIIGAVLAIPLTGVIKIVFDQIPATRPFSAMLSGDFSLAQTIASSSSEPASSPPPA